MRVQIIVRFKEGVLDPQGEAALHALQTLGFSSVKSVRVGKCIELDVEARDAHDAQTQTQRMCAELLSNPVMETAEIVVKG